MLTRRHLLRTGLRLTAASALVPHIFEAEAFQPPWRQPVASSQTITVGGASIQLDLGNGNLDLSHDAITLWVRRAVEAVAKYYGQLPHLGRTSPRPPLLRQRSSQRHHLGQRRRLTRLHTHPRRRTHNLRPTPRRLDDDPRAHPHHPPLAPRREPLARRRHRRLRRTHRPRAIRPARSDNSSGPT